MTSSRYEGAPPPPIPPTPTYQVLRPQKHGPLDVTVLADTIRGIVTHWVVSDETGVGSSLPCFQYEPGGCLYHDDRLEWSGWLPVYDHRQRKRAILHLAPKEADALVAVLGIDLRWRGCRVTVTPINNGQGRRIAVARYNEEAPSIDLRPHDMEHTICVVFGVPRLPRQTPAPPADEIPLPPPQKGGRP